MGDWIGWRAIFLHVQYLFLLGLLVVRLMAENEIWFLCEVNSFILDTRNRRWRHRLPLFQPELLHREVMLVSEHGSHFAGSKPCSEFTLEGPSSAIILERCPFLCFRWSWPSSKEIAGSRPQHHLNQVYQGISPTIMQSKTVEIGHLDFLCGAK